MTTKRDRRLLRTIPRAFLHDGTHHRAYHRRDAVYRLCIGWDGFEGLPEEDAKFLVNRYYALARRIGRLNRGKLVEVPFSLDIAKEVLKTIIFSTSDLDEPTIDCMMNLTGWHYVTVQKALDMLATEVFIERRRCCTPYQIVRRWE